MMTINLLRRSLEDARRVRHRQWMEGVVGFLAVGLTCIVLGWVWVDADRQIRSLEQQLENKQIPPTTRTQLEEEMKILSEERERLRQDLLRFEEVQRLRGEPARILATVSRNLNPLELWLETMRLEDGHLALTGFAGSRQEVLRFSQNIAAQPLFRAVTISETRTKQSLENVVHSFAMSISLEAEQVHASPS